MLKQAAAHESREHGATALIVASTLVLIMGMAAIAIDVGNGFNERRLDQTAADTAAMAGALGFQDEVEIVNQALDFAERNLRTTYSPPEWQALWQNCNDPDRPVDFEPLPEPTSWGSGTLDCISQSASFLRVRIPNQSIDTTFGRVLGFGQLETHAVAVATVRPDSSSNGLLPFAVRGGESAGEICLQAGPSGTSVFPCDGPSGGSFGAILSHWFGNDKLGTTPDCRDNRLQGSNNSSSILDDNMAVGIDHFVGQYENDSWTYPRATNDSKVDLENADAKFDDCDIVDGVAVATHGVPLDTVLVDVGNDLKDDVTRGLVANETFADGGPSRLQRGSNPKINLDSNGSIWRLDNRPLWEYLLPSAGSVVASCDPSEFSGDLDSNNQQMRDCLVDHGDTAGAGVIFEDAIARSPRFGWAPQLWHDDLGPGKSWRPVHNYRMVYLAGTFYNCNATDCGLIFYPGDPGPEPLCDVGPPMCKRLEVNQTTAFLFPEEALSADVRKLFPGGELGPFEPTLWR